MALAIFSVSPTNEQELAQWSFAHAAHHRDIIRVVYQNTGVNLNEFVLDPFDPNKDIGGWLWNHQQMHTEMNGLLGIEGNVLTSVEWKDKHSLDGWVSDNISEHYQAGQILGLG